MASRSGNRLGVIIVAAGRSTRMGGVDKTFATLLGAPLIAHTLDQFEAFPRVDEIVLVLAAESVTAGRELVRRKGYRKVPHVCSGGERRQDSVRNGLDLLEPCDWVMVHDGARPCLDQAVLERGMAAAAEDGAAVAGMPVKDTIKVVGDDARWRSLPTAPPFGPHRPRKCSATPCSARPTEFAMAPSPTTPPWWKPWAAPVRMFEGSYENLKVTTAEDLILAEAFLRAKGRRG